MAELKDSGTRREFGTGAVRDVAEGKGREDLLPLDIIGKHFFDEILISIDIFRNKCRDVGYLWKAFELFAMKRYGEDENGRPLHIGNDQIFANAILEVSKQYEDGARKYADDNWRAGIPLHCYIDSGVRHYLKWLRGDDDEPHDRAFMWNMLSCIWTAEHCPQMDDLPAIKSEPVDEDDDDDEVVEVDNIVY